MPEKTEGGFPGTDFTKGGKSKELASCFIALSGLGYALA
jgi:hypothetical protein